MGKISRTKAKTLGESLGMPDERDRQFIRALLLQYERRHPGLIKTTIQGAKKEVWENSTAFKPKLLQYGVVDNASKRRHLFELPADLIHEIEMQYPTMFREKKHFQWFVQNFKELLIPEKY